MCIKNIFKLSGLLSIAGIIVSASAAADQPYEVGTWGDFAKGAVSFTFDDNTSNQLTVAQPMFDKYKFHMTMFVVINWLGDKLSNYSVPFKAGHEIASHSVTHNDNPMKTSELGPSQDAIRKNVPGEMAVSIAYPNCPSPGDAEVKKYYIAGRICNGTPNGKTPSNFMQISSTICGSTGPNTAQALTEIATKAASDGAWNVYLMHGMSPVASGESDYSQTSPQALSGCLENLDKIRDQVWVETFGNVARYIKERDGASVKEKSASDEKIVVAVTDNMQPDSIYNFPLSVRRPLPDNWTTAFATQAGKDIWDSIVTIGGKKYIVFKAVPDGGDVTLTASAPTPVMKELSMLDDMVAPVRLYKNTLLINGHHFNNATLKVSIFNISGELINGYEIASNVSQVILPEGMTPSAPFVAKVSDGEKIWAGMLIAR